MANKVNHKVSSTQESPESIQSSPSRCPVVPKQQPFSVHLNASLDGVPTFPKGNRLHWQASLMARKSLFSGQAISLYLAPAGPGFSPWIHTKEVDLSPLQNNLDICEDRNDKTHSHPITFSALGQAASSSARRDRFQTRTPGVASAIEQLPGIQSELLKGPQRHISFPSSATDFLRFPRSGLCQSHPGEKQTFAWLCHPRETCLFPCTRDRP